MSYHSPNIAPLNARPAPAPSAHGAPSTALGEQPCIESAALLAGSKTLLIRHGGETYTLRLTRQNKLLLTK